MHTSLLGVLIFNCRIKENVDLNTKTCVKDKHVRVESKCLKKMK